MRLRKLVPLFFSLVCITILSFQACVDPIVSPPDDNIYLTFRDGNPSLLSFCEDQFEGSKDLSITVTVEGLTDDPSNPMRVTFEETFEIENTPSDLFGGTEYEIEVPESGTFQVDIEIRGGLACFDCCGDILVYDMDNGPTSDTGCPDNQGGSPRWTDGPVEVNKEPGIPEEIEAIPLLRNCSFCGC